MKTKSNNKDKTIKVKNFTLHSKDGNLHWPERDGGAVIATAGEIKAVANRVKQLMALGKLDDIELAYDGGTDVVFDPQEQTVAIGCQGFTFKEILDLAKKTRLK